MADRLARPFRHGAGRTAAADAGRAGPVPAGFGRQDQPGVQAEALDRGELAGSGRGALLLERHVFRRSSGEQIRPGSNGNGLQALVERLGLANARRGGPVSAGGSELLPAGRYSVQDGPDEHGAFAGGAAAVSGSPDCGVRGFAAAAVEDPRVPAEVHPARN